MYKCPFCQSTNCKELKDYYMPQSNTSYQTRSYNDDLVEMLCNDCGIVTKIDPRYYKDASNGEETN